MRNTKRKSNWSACSDFLPPLPHVMPSIHCSLKTGNFWRRSWSMKLQPQLIHQRQNDPLIQRPTPIGKHVLTKSSFHRPHLAKSWVVFKTSLRRFLPSWAFGLTRFRNKWPPLQNGSTLWIITGDSQWWQAGSGWCRWVPWRGQPACTSVPVATSPCFPSTLQTAPHPPGHLQGLVFCRIAASETQWGWQKRTTYSLFSAVLGYNWQINL